MKVGRWLPWIYALPMMVFVVAIFAYPIVTLFRYSVENVATSAFMSSSFAGLGNFRYIFTDSLFATALIAGRRPTIYGDGEQTRDFTYVANIVDGVLRACEAPAAAGEAINVACGTRISLNQLLRTMNQIVGTSLEVMKRIEGLRDQVGVDEMAVVTWAYDEEIRRRSYTLLAEAF